MRNRPVNKMTATECLKFISENIVKLTTAYTLLPDLL
jgi:hypothetical protein